MTGEYRFMRTRGGVTAFALVRVESSPNDVWVTVFGPQLEIVQSRYREALRSGIELAAGAHTRRGGVPQLVEVTALEDSVVDTRSDAVKCAAALAAWKSWNHSEVEGTVEFAGGEWNVGFP